MSTSGRYILSSLGTAPLMKGIQYYEGNNYEKAAKYFLAAARANNPEAIKYLYILGYYYLHKEDYVKALKLLSIVLLHLHQDINPDFYLKLKNRVEEAYYQIYYQALNFYKINQLSQALVNFTFLFEYPGDLNDDEYNQVLYHLGLLSLDSKNAKNAQEYFIEAALYGYRPAFDEAIKLFAPLIRRNIELYKEELWKQIMHNLRRALTDHSANSYPSKTRPTPLIKQRENGLEKATQLQENYDLKILSSCISNNKMSSQTKTINLFCGVSSIHRQNSLFLLLENKQFSILNAHTNPWLDWFFRIKLTASYCHMRKQIRTHAKEQLFKEFNTLLSEKDQLKLLRVAKRMKIFSAPTSNWSCLFFDQNSALTEINAKLSGLEEKSARKTQPRHA